MILIVCLITVGANGAPKHLQSLYEARKCLGLLKDRLNPHNMPKNIQFHCKQEISRIQTWNRRRKNNNSVLTVLAGNDQELFYVSWTGDVIGNCGVSLFHRLVVLPSAGPLTGYHVFNQCTSDYITVIIPQEYLLRKSNKPSGLYLRLLKAGIKLATFLVPLVSTSSSWLWGRHQTLFIFVNK